MHILFIPKWYPDHRDPQLGDFLRKQAIAVSGHARVSVLHVAPDHNLKGTPIQRVVEADGIWELHCHYPVAKTGPALLRKLLNLPVYWRTAMNGFARVVRERGMPDLGHVHILVRPAVLALALKRRYGMPYIISEQSSEYLDGTFAAKGAAHLRFCRHLFAQAAAITAVSAWLGDRLVELGLTRSYTAVPNVIPGLDRALPPAGDPRHFTVVADLVDKTKNVSGVLRALAMARKQQPALRLTVIGDGPDRSMLEDLMHRLGLTDAVEFRGRLANHQVLDHVATTGCVIINSNVETFSVVTGEALALGKPVIATRCGGPIAFVTPENGLLINTRDDAALCAALLSMSAAGERYSPARIRASVNERFSYDAVGRAFMNVYSRATAHGT
jgi:glycosyltransferase involved in cell wall biosynthesis